jgi:hypothetical protein
MTHAREIAMALSGQHTMRLTDASYSVSSPVPSHGQRNRLNLQGMQ